MRVGFRQPVQKPAEAPQPDPGQPAGQALPPGLEPAPPGVRPERGITAEEFPLARVLEGGSWAAGREIARERRPDGNPPLRIISDGTLF